MTKIAIVTDSTAMFPYQKVGDVPVFTVPLQCIWGDQILRDGVDIQTDEFYEKLKTADVLPTTSQPSPADFKTVFDSLLADGYEILAILISSGISGTVNSAVQAKAMLPDAPIEILDSMSTSLIVHFQIMEAVEALQAGANLTKAREAAESVLNRSAIYFTVQTLEFLERGGRLSKMEAAAGNLLKIRPILSLADGKIISKTKTRTYKKAVRMIADIIAEELQGHQLKRIAGLYTEDPETCREIVDELSERICGEKKEDAFISLISPVIGTHTGPGTFGLAYLYED
ncbi:MAG: DegV family protein [Anaerolineaceae bacterium]|nr:DegV family protein [Anaerolineaceae bacterium]